MSTNAEKEFFIHFDHLIPCNKGSCVVVGYYNGVGTATVISPYDPEAVLRLMPYKAENDETLELYESWYVPDYAWYVRYEFEGTRRYGYAVFSKADWRFKWYEVEEDLLWVSFSKLLS